jgi:hypothetical protein
MQNVSQMITTKPKWKLIVLSWTGSSQMTRDCYQALLAHLPRSIVDDPPAASPVHTQTDRRNTLSLPRPEDAV